MNMKKRLARATALTLLVLAAGCREGKGVGTISGTIEIPPGQLLKNTSIAATQAGVEKAVAPVDPKSGKFAIVLPSGGPYDLKLKTPKGNLEIVVALEVKPGKIADAGAFPAPVDLFDDASVGVPSVGTPPSTVSVGMKPVATDERQAGILATVSGNVYPADAGIKITSDGKLIAEGKATGGSFSIPSVPPGLYDVEFSAPGYATAYVENVAVAAEGALVDLNEFLLFASPTDGVDYNRGTITASGKGAPNPSMQGAQALLMSCRAARVVAMRNLVNEILKLKVGPEKSITSLDSDGRMKTVLEGFVQNARVVSETKNSDNTCEITLEIPLNGKSGVSSYLRELNPR